MCNSIMRFRETQKVFERTCPNLGFPENQGENYPTENGRAYEKNRAFRRYVDRCCANRGIPKEEALRHELITQVRKHYEESEEKDGFFMVFREGFFEDKMW